jgi:uncharacterized protein (DUF305 family)
MYCLMQPLKALVCRAALMLVVPVALLATARSATAQSVSSSAAAGAVRVTPADIRFMQDMIGHHSQALAMTRLLRSRTRRADMRLLAERIDVSQRDEIGQMRQWLTDHGAPATGSSPIHSEHNGGDHAMVMPGMLSAEQMAALRQARGKAFDRLFLAGMIQHHEGALRMVRDLRTVDGAGQESSIFRFTADVDADQRAEIARMQRMLSLLQ